MAPWSLFGVDWSDWVIRFPGGGSALGTAIGILIALLVIFALIRGTISIADKITGFAWSLVTLAAFIVFVLVVAELQEDDPPAPVVDHEIRADECPEQFLGRCPPLTDDPNYPQNDPNRHPQDPNRHPGG